jgi:hypothetical protein
MSDFAKFIPQKELVYLVNLIIHMAAIECKVAMCISRLVEFELLLELKFEQKKGTSLVKPVLSRRKSGLRQSVCPSQLYN